MFKLSKKCVKQKLKIGTSYIKHCRLVTSIYINVGILFLLKLCILFYLIVKTLTKLCLDDKT